MLGPEERAILEQNEAPNLDKLPTAKWEPLYTFALAGQINFMDGLLEKGYNIDLLDKDGLTALHLAIIGKRKPIISCLFSKKDQIRKPRIRDGATPLHYAAQVGAKQTVKLFIKYKVDVNAADNEGWTPVPPPKPPLRLREERREKKINWATFSLSRFNVSGLFDEIETFYRLLIVELLPSFLARFWLDFVMILTVESGWNKFGWIKGQSPRWRRKQKRVCENDINPFSCYGVVSREEAEIIQSVERI